MSGLSDSQADRALDLDFDLDLPLWSPDTSGGASSPYTGKHPPLPPCLLDTLMGFVAYFVHSQEFYLAKNVLMALKLKLACLTRSHLQMIEFTQTVHL